MKDEVFKVYIIIKRWEYSPNFTIVGVYSSKKAATDKLTELDALDSYSLDSYDYEIVEEYVTD